MRVLNVISEDEISSYRKTANSLNAGNVELTCLQHEFGIFGGKAGSHVLELLQHLAMPVVTTLHTVLREPNPDQRSVMKEIAARSDRLVVMSEYSSGILQEVFGVSASKIDLIPHGIPDLPFVEPEVDKAALGLKGKHVLLTFGLLSPNKGFENAIRALPRILASNKDVVYLIAGATHPHVRAREGDRYRSELEDLASKLGVEREVIFLNRFFSPRGNGFAGWVGRHLHYAVLPQGTGCIGNPGLCHGRRQGHHLYSLLACRRTARRGARSVGPFREPGCHCSKSYSTSGRREGTLFNAQARIPLRAQYGLEPGCPILHALFLTGSCKSHAACAPRVSRPFCRAYRCSPALSCLNAFPVRMGRINTPIENCE